VIRCRSGQIWTPAALMTWTNGDLRDAKIAMTSGGELMLSGAVAFPQPGAVRHVSLAWFSRDGRSWSSPVEIGDTNFWLWRTTWHQRVAYSIGYETTAESFVLLYTSTDGPRF